MKVDPKLEPLPENPRHRVACLLATETRKKLWRELREGTAPVEARADVMQDKPPAEAIEALEETEGRAAGSTVEET